MSYTHTSTVVSSFQPSNVVDFIVCVRGSSLLSTPASSILLTIKHLIRMSSRFKIIIHMYVLQLTTVAHWARRVSSFGM